MYISEETIAARLFLNSCMGVCVGKGGMGGGSMNVSDVTHLNFLCKEMIGRKSQSPAGPPVTFPLSNNPKRQMAGKVDAFGCIVCVCVCVCVCNCCTSHLQVLMYH